MNFWWFILYRCKFNIIWPLKEKHIRAGQDQTKNSKEKQTSVEMSDISNKVFHYHCRYPNLGNHLMPKTIFKNPYLKYLLPLSLKRLSLLILSVHLVHFPGIVFLFACHQVAVKTNKSKKKINTYLGYSVWVGVLESVVLKLPGHSEV